jgi:general secretion pathway protein E
MDSLPFDFANKNAVLLDADGGTLFITPRTPLWAVTEVRRVAARAERVECLGEAGFAARLNAFYASRKDSSALVMADIQDDVDLQSLAGSLAEEGDLLARDDDAPIIRLLNAILAEVLYGKAQTVCWGHIGMDGMQK